MMTKTGLIAAVVMGCSAFAAGSAFAMTSAVPHRQATKDAKITAEVKQNLIRDLPDSRYQVRVRTTRDGIVTLSGQADTGYSELKALKDARKVPGVTEVKDHLRIVA